MKLFGIACGLGLVSGTNGQNVKHNNNTDETRKFSKTIKVQMKTGIFMNAIKIKMKKIK